jgi:dolichol-phosphate mannosyltransferase
MSTPAVTVVVPAFDEAALLAANLAELHRTLVAAPWPFEIVVVDDGSTDATAAIAASAARDHTDIRVVTHDHNRGLGAALRTGIRAALAPVVVTLDADLTYGPEHVDALVAACGDDVAIVVASPYGPGGRVSGVPAHRLVLSKVANRLLTRKLGLATSTSMVRAYRRASVLPVVEGLADADVLLGVLAEVRDAGGRIVEIPAHLDWTRAPDRVSKQRFGPALLAVLRAALTRR